MSNKMSWRARLSPFADPAMWLLFAVSAIPLAILDPAMLLTMVQWTLLGVLFMGVTILLSRIAFPQLSVEDLMRETWRGNVGPALIVAALVLFVGLTFLGVVLWARG